MSPTFEDRWSSTYYLQARSASWYPASSVQLKHWWWLLSSMCRAKILRTYLTSVKLAYQTGMQLLWDIRRNCATCNTPVGRSSFLWSSGNSCTLVREPTSYFGFHRDTVLFPELFVSHSVFTVVQTDFAVQDWMYVFTFREQSFGFSQYLTVKNCLNFDAE